MLPIARRRCVADYFGAGGIEPGGGHVAREPLRRQWHWRGGELSARRASGARPRASGAGGGGGRWRRLERPVSQPQPAHCRQHAIANEYAARALVVRVAADRRAIAARELRRVALAVGASRARVGRDGESDTLAGPAPAAGELSRGASQQHTESRRTGALRYASIYPSHFPGIA